MTDSNLVAHHGIVVMLDALGVRDYTYGQAKNYIKHKNELEALLNDKSILVQKWVYDSINDEAFPETSGYVKKRKKIKIDKPDVITFGDTLIIYWNIPEISIEIALWYLQKLISNVIPFGIENDIYWRGSIGIGDYFIDDTSKTTILGPAIKDAVSWYEMADWIGIIASPRCCFKYDNLVNHLSFLEPLDIIKYKVPMKNGSSQSMYAINWVNSYCGYHDRMALTPKKEQAVERYNERLYKLTNKFSNIKITRGIERKYFNTRDFFEYCVKHNLKYINEEY